MSTSIAQKTKQRSFYLYDVKRLSELIASKDVSALRAFMQEHDLIINGGRIEPREDVKAEFRKLASFWSQRQLARKILLNSLYGALLNPHMRMADERLGQSTTLSGRTIVRHMNSKINEIITGTYAIDGLGIYYSDTDSSYFSAYEVLKDHPDYKDFDWSKENIIALYDMIADETNDTFPEFMRNTFHTTLKRGGLIKAGRELVASQGLFIKKKKYAVMIYDLEGKRLDEDGKPGKLKAMGLDLKRADTPRFMQKFLEQILSDILVGKGREELYADVREFRREFKHRPGWEKGAPKKVRNLNQFQTLLNNAAKRDMKSPLRRGEKLKVNMPGHVRASLNWNLLCELSNDRHTTRITDSARIIVCKLRNNSYDMTSIAYPIDETHLPKWFQELPFDHDAMESVIIDKKLTNLVGVLEWDLKETMEYAGDDFFA